MGDSTVNSVITDSVTQNNTLLTSIAAPQGQALVDLASAETMGMAMYNAISAQQNAQLTTNASVTATCAKMLGVDAGSGLPAGLAPAPKTPPPFMPLTPAGATEAAAAVDANTLIEMATNLADSAAKDITDNKGSDAETEKSLEALITKLQGMQSSLKPKDPPKPQDPPPSHGS